MKKQPLDPPASKQPATADQITCNNLRLQRQIDFLMTADALKHIDRRTVLLDKSRRENSAEHSWHIALMALVLGEYAHDRSFDSLHVLRMLLIHDLIEIDAGDTYCYDTAGYQDKPQRERLAADRLFNLLPPDQADDFRHLWDEFEAGITAEARFANALDRLQPFFHNCLTQGFTWQESDVKRHQVEQRMEPVGPAAPELGRLVADLMDHMVKIGYLAG